MFELKCGEIKCDGKKVKFYKRCLLSVTKSLCECNNVVIETHVKKAEKLEFYFIHTWMGNLSLGF